MGTCTVFTTPDKKSSPAAEEPIQYTEDGRMMVSLGIGFGGDGNGRALTDLLALAGAERFEAAFYYAGGGNPADAQVYRASWSNDQRGKLWVQTSIEGINYAADGNGAVLFAGFRNHALLAVGRLVLVDGRVGTTISSVSRSVTFELVPFNNDLFGELTNGSRNPLESSFKITNVEPRSGQDTTGWNAYLNGGDTPGFTAFKMVPVNGFRYPVFEMPNDAIFDVEYAIDFGDLTEDIVVAGQPDIVVGAVNVSSGYRAAPTNQPNIQADFVGLAVGDALPDEPFALQLTTDAVVDGLLRVSITVPVHPWSDAPGWNQVAGDRNVPPGVWFIQGGISNAVLDRGATEQSAGGAILMGIGEYYDGDPPGYTLIVYDDGKPRHYRSSDNINTISGHAFTYNIPGVVPPTPTHSAVDWEYEGETGHSGASKKLVRMQNIDLGANNLIEYAFEVHSDAPINLLEEGVLALSFWAKSNRPYGPEPGSHSRLFEYVGFGNYEPCPGVTICDQRHIISCQQSFLFHGFADKTLPANTWKRF
ncbi:MAG: hypothetical protein FWD36_07350, partial [Treponema sp.]|nr:hypothetical protein [Treponema sp.]